MAEKSHASREISGLLFAAEATALDIVNQARIAFLRIKTHAHVFSALNPPRTTSDSVWDDYNKLESLLRARL